MSCPVDACHFAVPYRGAGKARTRGQAERLAPWLQRGMRPDTGLCSLGNQWFRTLAYQVAARVSALAPLLYFGVVVALALETLWSGRLPSSNQLLGTACVILAAVGAGRRPAAPRPAPVVAGQTSTSAPQPVNSPAGCNSRDSLKG